MNHNLYNLIYIYTNHTKIQIVKYIYIIIMQFQRTASIRHYHP